MPRWAVALIAGRECAAFVVAMCICGCREVASPAPFDIKMAIGPLLAAPIDSSGAVIFPTGLDVNESGLVVGNLTFSGTAEGFTWRNGTFLILPSSTDATTVRAVNNLGDIVGVYGGRPMIWYAGEPAPTPIFRPDTDYVIASAVDVNDRREVYLYLNGRTTAVWFRDAFRVVSTQCSIPIAINNLGIIAYETCGEPHDNWVLAPSPFGSATITSSSRFAQGAGCKRGRQSTGYALSDSNEVIGTTDLSPDVGKSADVWIAGGCLNVTATYPALTLRVFNNRGVLGGWRVDGTDTTAVLAMNGAWISLNDLVGASSIHFTQTYRITDSRFILAYGYRISDAKRVVALLRPR